MRLLLSLLASGILLHAAFDPHAWATRRQVRTTTAPFNVVIVDAGIYTCSKAQLRDLRLVRAGQEVPYALRNLLGSREEKQFTPAILNKAAIPGQGLQVVLDVGPNSPHNRVKVDTSRTNFRQQVRIETSDDSHHWGMVRSDGTIFDVSTADQHSADRSVSYPDSTQRFIRVTIKGWTDPDWLQSASVSYLRETAATRDVIADLRPGITEDLKLHQTVLDFDRAQAGPFDRITFAVGPGLFSRRASLTTSADRKNWTAIGSTLLARTTGEENLTAEVSEQWERYVTVTISNLDNAPLTITGGRFEGLRRELVFPAQEPGPYWLYSGNPIAEQANYDLASVLPAKTSALPATVGPNEPNPDFQPPQPPLTDRSSWLLTALLLILVPVVGMVAFRMLRQVKAAE